MKLLTKSRFKLGLECPNKLFYTKKDAYANQKIDDPFLMALADGGFQVEELARMHYPDGILLEDNYWDYKLLASQTKKLLEQENVVIYEAAFLVDGLFIRTDILVKKENEIQLIEVKSKSYNATDVNLFIGKKGGIVKAWKPYLFDIAFQKYVMQLCYPEWNIKSYLMMADKNAKASINGLNQSFRITKKANNRTGIIKLENEVKKLGDPVLVKVNISDIVRDIISNKYKYHDNMGFMESVAFLKETYINDKYSNWQTSYRACKACEFKATKTEEEKGLKSGFKECFQKQHHWSHIDFETPNNFNIWDFRRGEKLLEEGIIFKKDLTLENIGHKDEVGKISRTDRQWLQIEKELNKDTTSYVDLEGLRIEIATWNYPLHFIDFETSTVALPFNKGRHPYEQIAFQFSHHIYYEDGTIKHASEYINNKAGVFPNFEFIRELKQVLENDRGSVFKFAAHENTIVNAIYKQLLASNEADKEELIIFIKSISHNKKDSVAKWKGDRDMIDLCDVIKKYYYNPYTEGSNSIKMVLPAILKTSDFLRAKYSKPIGGINLSSKNFNSDHIWLEVIDGEVINPYKLLPKVFDEWTEEQLEQVISEIEDVADGGAALTAYGKLQYTDMSEDERKTLSKALLKYCELDTLAMVMIFEHFKNDLLKI